MRVPATSRRNRTLGIVGALALVSVMFVAPPAAAGPGAAHASARAGTLRATALPPVRPYVFRGDVRDLPAVASHPAAALNLQPPAFQKSSKGATSAPAESAAPASASMPAPSANFAGLSFSDSCTGGACGGGWPPDTVGDVGPNHYIEGVNTSVGIFSKTGTRLAAFTFDSLWSTSGSSTPCNGSNEGDPTVVYDPIADRWIVSDFAFGFDLSGNTVAPYYECIAASASGDPVSGGWYLYAIQTDPGTAGAPPAGYLADYPKMGVWPNGIYMTANEFDSTDTFKGVSVWAFNRAQLESGAALQQVVVFAPLAPATPIFGALPANLRGALPPSGTPEYIVSESLTGFYFDVRKFTVNWSAVPPTGSLGSATSVSQTSYDYTGGDIIPQPGTSNTLDSLIDRLMMQAQYRNISGTESLWVTHTVQSPTAAPSGIQWAQLNVTGGSISTTPVQQQIFTNGGDGLWRWMPSLAVDQGGNMAVGYSVSGSSAPYPSINYAGRLASDPLGQLSQGEATLQAGAGSQTNSCGGAPCPRWGDYTSMSVDPVDDCTFWYVGEYYDSPASGASGDWHTRIGSFAFPSCASTPGPVPVTTTGTMLRYYSQIGRYHLYHEGKNVYFRGKVQPVPDTSRLYFTWQVLGRRGWKTMAEAHFAMSSNGVVTVFIDEKALDIGNRYRIDCEFRGDVGHLADASPWSYFRITN